MTNRQAAECIRISPGLYGLAVGVSVEPAVGTGRVPVPWIPTLCWSGRRAGSSERRGGGCHNREGQPACPTLHYLELTVWEICYRYGGLGDPVPDPNFITRYDINTALVKFNTLAIWWDSIHLTRESRWALRIHDHNTVYIYVRTTWIIFIIRISYGFQKREYVVNRCTLYVRIS